MRPKIHACELADSGGVKVGVAMGALSVDHLESMSEEDIPLLKASQTMPTALPGTSFFLNMPYAPVRKMIDAGLGVAIVILAMGGSLGGLLGESVGSYIAILVGALMGAGVVLVVLIAFSVIVRSNTMLLIIGILVSYLTSSVVQLLNSVATEEGVHNYVAWGFGNFSGVSAAQMPVYAGIIILALIASALMVKPLNALLLGARYARNLGINVSSTRNILLLITGVLTAVVTAFCGPIGFIGLVVPHIARMSLGTSNHARLVPATILAGADIALLCSLASVSSPHGIIPINAITPVIGVPIILYIIINRRRIQYFN
jgi:iron complex transport system permease protein